MTVQWIWGEEDAGILQKVYLQPPWVEKINSLNWCAVQPVSSTWITFEVAVSATGNRWYFLCKCFPLKSSKESHSRCFLCWDCFPRKHLNGVCWWQGSSPGQEQPYLISCVEDWKSSVLTLHSGSCLERNHLFLFVLFFSFFLCFLGLHPWHMEVPRWGFESELQLRAYTTAPAT